MVTSGPLLPLWDDKHTEYTYDCVSCRLDGRSAVQHVTFWSGDEVPQTMDLPCYAAALDARTGLERVPTHRFKLIGPVRPAGDQ